MNQQNIAGHFDAEAVRYDNAYDAGGTIGRNLRQRQLAALNLLGDGPGNLLDAGLGPGRLSEQACRRKWTAIGVDISDRMVALAQARLRAVDAAVLLASVERLPFRASSFDAIVATGLFGHVPDIDAFFDEVHRLLRTDGRLIISVQNVSSLRHLWRSAVWYPTVRFAKRYVRTSRPAPVRRSGPVTLGELKEKLRQRGLTVTAVSYVGFGFVTPRTASESHLGSANRRAAGDVEDRSGPLRRRLASAMVVSAVLEVIEAVDGR